jgi:antitoxin component of RelBE/YafQ-DinJ toxin-antitoxin module
MDAKVTLKFDKDIINQAKAYAEKQGISLSRLTEFLYKRISENSYSNLEDFPISDWVNMVAEGEAEYKPKKKISHKAEYYESRK